MNTCGTCKHFGDPVEDASDDIYVPTGYHVCRLIQQRAKHDDPPQGDLALVVDGSGYYAALCVKEEFGCNQWAERPAASSDPEGAGVEVPCHAVFKGSICRYSGSEAHCNKLFIRCRELGNTVNYQGWIAPRHPEQAT